MTSVLPHLQALCGTKGDFAEGVARCLTDCFPGSEENIFRTVAICGALL